MLSGVQIRELRDELGLAVAVVAQLLGSHVSSVYRWEASERAKVGALRRNILLVLMKTTRKMTPEERRCLGEEISEAIALGGPLRGLYVALKPAYAEMAKRLEQW